jgi:hypothetical protein
VAAAVTGLLPEKDTPFLPPVGHRFGPVERHCRRLRRRRRDGQLGRDGLEADMNRLLFAAAMLAAFLIAPVLIAPAHAQTKVGDWTVEKRTQDNHCNASRGYKDADDENNQYGIVLSYSNDRIVMVIIYEGWEWEKTGDVLKADFATDNVDIKKKSKWEVMDKTTVRGVFEFDQAIVDALSKAKRLTIDFEDDDDDSIELQTPRAGEMLAALKYCEENRK